MAITDMRRQVTLKDVAAHVGVSHTTVSNAFSQPDRLSVALRTRILDAARELGYGGPDPTARHLRRGRVDALGLVLSHDYPYALSDPAALGVLRGVGEVCGEIRSSLLLIPSHDKEARSTKAAIPGQAAVDGLILYSLASDSDAVLRAARRTIPIVTIDQPRLADRPFVGVNPAGAIRNAAAHVASLGHQRMAMLSLKMHMDGMTGPADEARIRSSPYAMVLGRIDAWRASLMKAGIACDDMPVWECSEALEPDARHATAALLAAVPRPTLLIALSDRLAIAAIETARALGLAVPGDVSVIGFDDIGPASMHGLATIAQPHVLKGRTAAHMLVDREASMETWLPAQFIMRGSVGPAASP